MRGAACEGQVRRRGEESLKGGFAGGELFNSAESRKAVIELVRQFRRTFVLAHAENDYHTDHRDHRPVFVPR